MEGNEKKDYVKNMKRTCAEIQYDFKKRQDIQGKWKDLNQKGKETEVTRE